ncbi:MAG: hypothetical protein SGBAC_011479, partial [Bacillariaceae sp.]
MKSEKAGLVTIGGETTSLAIKDKSVAVGVSTSRDFLNPAGSFQVIDRETRAIVATIDMGGQPGSVALSSDKNFVAIAIENRRDENVDNSTKIAMTGLESVLQSSDPEPLKNDVAKAEVLASFSAGTATVTNFDVEDENIIAQNVSVTVTVTVRCVPDCVTWIGNDTATSTWNFMYYPLDAPASQNGGRVGLSDIASLGNGESFVLERYNQGPTDESTKAIYQNDLGNFSIVDGETVEMRFAHDLIPDMLSTGGLANGKVEGLAVEADGNVWVSSVDGGIDRN